MVYNFLVISILFLIPGVIIYLFRKDLRPVIHVMILFSLPFAFTESLFYPTYWEPVFLFNLIDIIGFGIEDLMFVAGLGAFTSTIYAFAFNYKFQSRTLLSLRNVLTRGLILMGITFFLVLVVASMQIPMIYGCVVIMILMALAIFILRTDLWKPGFMGGMLTLIIYSGLCIIINLIYPQIFDLTWHTKEFLHIFVLGIPIEEMLYAFSSGVIATAFYPFVFDKDLIKKNTPVSTIYG